MKKPKYISQVHRVSVTQTVCRKHKHISVRTKGHVQWFWKSNLTRRNIPYLLWTM